MSEAGTDADLLERIEEHFACRPTSSSTAR
jgi:hypothetical protein